MTLSYAKRQLVNEEVDLEAGVQGIEELSSIEKLHDLNPEGLIIAACLLYPDMVK